MGSESLTDVGSAALLQDPMLIVDGILILRMYIAWADLGVSIILLQPLEYLPYICVS